MRIGALARRTAIPTRMPRYYESQGLLRSTREPNGYRDYAEDQVERASRVRSLIQSGLSSRMTRTVLKLEYDESPVDPLECPLSVVEELSQEMVALDERLECLAKSRHTVARFLEAAQQSSTAEPQGVGSPSTSGAPD